MRCHFDRQECITARRRVKRLSDSAAPFAIAFIQMAIGLQLARYQPAIAAACATIRNVMKLPASRFQAHFWLIICAAAGLAMVFLFDDSCQQDGGQHYLFARWAW